MDDTDTERSRPVGISKLAVIGPLAFLAAMAQGNLGLGLLFHARDALLASKAQTGLLAGIWFLAYMISCHLFRPLSHRLRPRFCVLGACFVLAALTALLAAAPSLGLAYLLNGLLGAAAASFWPPLMGWVSANAEGGRLSRRLGTFNLCWSSGAILSPALAGWGHELSSRLPLVASAILYLAAGLLIALAVVALPGIGKDDDAHEREQRGVPREPGADGTPLRFPAWAGVFSTYLVAGVLLNVFPMAGRTELHLRASDVGRLLLLRAFATSAGLWILGRTAWWHFRGGQMVAATALLGASLLWLGSARSMAGIGAALVAAGALSAFGYVNSLFHGAVGSSRRVARMAIHESLLSAGLCCGASLGGVVYQRVGITPLLTGCAVLMGATASIQLVLLAACRRPRPDR